MDRDGARARLVNLGLDHSTAGVEWRERIAFADAEIPPVLQRLVAPATGPLEQAAILSTCNRVEVYGVARRRGDEGRLRPFLAHYHGLDTTEVVARLHVHRGDQVAHRLAETAAGMHSLVLGEPQILGQIRRALDLALAAGTAGVELRRMFESAISAGRRVRSGTAIGRGSASVPHASVEFARRRLGTLDKTTVLLVGTGEMTELAAKQLVRHGAKEILVSGRSVCGANRFVERYDGRVVSPDGLEDALSECHLVISATSAPTPTVHVELLQRALARRDPASPPLLLIDLSVPRSIDPRAMGLDGVEGHAIDDLHGMAQDALMQRRAELPRAQLILEAEVTRFTRWLSRREALVPVEAT